MVTRLTCLVLSDLGDQDASISARRVSKSLSSTSACVWVFTVKMIWTLLGLLSDMAAILAMLPPRPCPIRMTLAVADSLVLLYSSRILVTAAVTKLMCRLSLGPEPRPPRLQSEPGSRVK